MKIALIGYGKMGKMIEEIALSRGHEIVSIIDIDNQQDFESEAFASADVAIEFTAPQAAYGNFLKAFAKNVKVVSGSTGWMKDHTDDVKRFCGEEGKTLFWASNFSVGVAIFSAVNRYLAKIMNGFPQYDAHMEETHHIHKIDAPSGTAIMLADAIREERPDLHYNMGRSGMAKREKDEIGINAVRMGNIAGTHEVMFGTNTQTITIKHEAHDRALFADGAVAAARFLAGQPAGLYNMDDLLAD